MFFMAYWPLPWHGAEMDMPMRLIIAFSIMAGCVLLAVPMLIVFLRRRRADKLRRRGIKSYNRKPQSGSVRTRSGNR
jgi:hypothetical protein